MLKGEKKYINRRFEYYLRQCLDCGNLFKSKSKKGCYCEECKKIRTHDKIKKSLNKRGFDFKLEEVIKKWSGIV